MAQDSTNFKVEISQLVVKSLKSGIEYLVPKLADWIITEKSFKATMDANGQFSRTIVLQDGTLLEIILNANKLQQVWDKYKQSSQAEIDPQTICTTHIFNIEPVSPESVGAGSFNLAGLIGVTW